MACQVLSGVWKKLDNLKPYVKQSEINELLNYRVRTEQIIRDNEILRRERKAAQEILELARQWRDEDILKIGQLHPEPSSSLIRELLQNLTLLSLYRYTSDEHPNRSKWGGKVKLGKTAAAESVSFIQTVKFTSIIDNAAFKEELDRLTKYALSLKTMAVSPRTTCNSTSNKPNKNRLNQKRASIVKQNKDLSSNSQTNKHDAHIKVDMKVYRCLRLAQTHTNACKITSKEFLEGNLTDKFEYLLDNYGISAAAPLSSCSEVNLPTKSVKVATSQTIALPCQDNSVMTESVATHEVNSQTDLTLPPQKDTDSSILPPLHRQKSHEIMTECNRSEIDDRFLPPLSRRTSSNVSDHHDIVNYIQNLHYNNQTDKLGSIRRINSAPNSCRRQSIQHHVTFQSIKPLTNTTRRKSVMSRGVSARSLMSKNHYKPTVRVAEKSCQTDQEQEVQGPLDADPDIDVSDNGVRTADENMLRLNSAGVEMSLISHISLETSDCWEIILERLLLKSGVGTADLDDIKQNIEKTSDNIDKIKAVFKKWKQVAGRFDVTVLIEVLQSIYRNDLVEFVKRHVGRAQLYYQLQHRQF